MDWESEAEDVLQSYGRLPPMCTYCPWYGLLRKDVVMELPQGVFHPYRDNMHLCSGKTVSSELKATRGS